MAQNSESPFPSESEAATRVEEITEVLLAVAQGDTSRRASRSNNGDPLDVLSFLVNSTAEEIGQLLLQLAAEREQLQAARGQLVMAAKLAALGRLAAGVAHELNQPLTAVRLIIDVLSAAPELTLGECRDELDLIGEAVRRMGRIIDGVRTFGRGEALDKRLGSPTAPLEGAVQLLAARLTQGAIAVEKRYAEGLPAVVLDSDRMHQVFVNLLSNAHDALCTMPPDRRRLVLDVRHTEGSLRYAIDDTGPGVAPELAERIFDPFYTTKDVGKGTGLGLSVSHGIVEAHGGRLWFEPSELGGARFVVALPAHEN